MNKHWVAGLVALATLAGCNRSTDLAVQVVTSEEGGDVRPLAQQVVRLLPYDRDSIFNVLAQQADEPEPEPPQTLVELRDSVAAAQERWREAEAAWNDIRSELVDLRDRMDRMDRSSNEYFEAFQRFDDLDAQVQRLDRAKQGYFERFTELQSTYNERADSFNAVLRAWEGTAFEAFGEIADSLAEAAGGERRDTTGDGGWANLTAPRGTWWIYTRSPLVFEELYWNVVYESTGGADTVILNESNADIRPIF